MQTHETYIHAVAAIAIANLDDADRAALRPFKLVYGIGRPGVRGVTVYGTWHNGEPEPEEVVEIGAGCEDSLCQIAGTTIHEIAHVLAGFDAGHGAGWVEACRKLGLRRVHAAGTHYQPANFAPAVREAIAALPAPTDGRPGFAGYGGPDLAGLLGLLGGFVGSAAPAGWAPRPCQSTSGCKGGKSRGKGSGSRLVKVVCADSDCGYTLRTTKKWIAVGLPTCACGSEMAIAG